MFPEPAEQAQFVAVQTVHDDPQDGAAAQGEQRDKANDWKAATFLLGAGLRVGLLIFRRVSDLSRRAVHYLDRASAQATLAAGTAASVKGRGRQSLFHPFLRQTLAGLNISGVALIYQAPSVQSK